MSEILAANNNIKTPLKFIYPKQIDEVWLRNYPIFDGAIQEVVCHDRTNFADRIINGEDTFCHLKWYHDILDTSGRPNYKAIEALGILIQETAPQKGYWHSLCYEQYQVRTQHVDAWSNFLAFNWIEFINHNVASHLLGLLVTAFECGHIPYKASYSELQKILNEAKENIASGLEVLKDLNLIYFKRRGAEDLIIELNEANILAITPRNAEDEETLNRIEQKYGIKCGRWDEIEEYLHESHFKHYIF